MALKLEDEAPGNADDDNQPAWRTNLEGDDGLEDAYNAPSAGDDDLPEGHPDRSDSGASSPGELANAESNPESSSSDSPDDKEGGLYSGTDDSRSMPEKIRGTMTGKRAAGGGIAVVLIGGSIFFASFASGPLQFIHLAKMMQGFHLQQGEDNGDSRILSAYKNYRLVKNVFGGTLENSRLGIVGEHVAKNLDTKMIDAGIEKQYNFAGTYKGTAIDISKFGETEAGSAVKGMSPTEAEAYFKTNLNIDAHIEGGKLYTEDSGFMQYFKNRRVNRLVSKTTGIQSLPGAITTRIMIKRDHVPLLPIKAADAYITGSVEDWLTQQVKKIGDRIRNGDRQKLTVDGKEVKNGDEVDQGATDQNRGAASNTDEVVTAATESLDEAEQQVVRGSTEAGGETAGLISRLKDSAAGGATLKATAVLGLVCAAKGISEGADALKHDMVVLPLIRTGMQFVALGNQAELGNQADGPQMTARQMGIFARQLNSKKYGNWTAAKSIQAESGKEQTGRDMPEDAKLSNIGPNMFSQFLNIVPGLGTVCDVTNSAVGGFVMTVVGVFTGPLQEAAGQIVSRSGVLDGPINSLVRWIAGSPIPTMVAGPDLGNYVNYGVKLAANDSNAALGGIPLTPAESAALRQSRLQGQADDMADRSFAQRMFDPYSPDSLVGKAVDSTSSSTMTNMASMFSGLINPTSFIKSFGSIFSGKVNAAAGANYDYGFDEIGFSLDDLQSDKYADVYDNGFQVINALKGGGGDKLISRAQSCFGVTLTKDGGVTSSFQSLDVTQKDFYSNSNSCADKTDLWTRVRLYILDTKTLEAADCFQSGDDQSCTDVGFGSTAATAQSTSIGGNLPTGTPEELKAKILASGKVTFDPGISLDGLKATTLAIALKLTEKYSFQISSAVRPGCGCPHGDGSAIDINGLNGVHYANDYSLWDPNMQNFENDVASLLPSGSWMGVPNQTYIDKTSVIAKPKGVTVDIDPGTGAHFHFNIPTGTQ